MKRYFEMSREECMADSDRVAVLQFEEELKKKPKRKVCSLELFEKPWEGCYGSSGKRRAGEE